MPPGPPARLVTWAALAGTIDPKDAARRAADLLAKSTDPAEAEDLVSRFTRLQRTVPFARSRPPSPARLPPGRRRQARPPLRSRQPRGSPRRSARPARLGDAPKPLTDAEKQSLLAAVASQGDPARGRSCFPPQREPVSELPRRRRCRRPGPARAWKVSEPTAPVDYLLDSLVEPGKAIKENYHSLVVATKDGQIISGIKLRQTGQELILRNAEDPRGRRSTLRHRRAEAGGSLMPAGLVEPLTSAPSWVDLVRFLSELGKIGPYSVSKSRIVPAAVQALEATPATYHELRRWGLQTVAKTGGSGYGSSDSAALTWSPAYSQVSGLLPLGDLPVITLGPLPGSGAEVGATGFARFQLDVSTPGPVRLALNSPRGLTLWVDGTSVEPRESIDLDLTAGLHTVTFAVKLGDRSDPSAAPSTTSPAPPPAPRSSSASKPSEDSHARVSQVPRTTKTSRISLDDGLPRLRRSSHRGPRQARLHPVPDHLRNLLRRRPRLESQNG